MVRGSDMLGRVRLTGTLCGRLVPQDLEYVRQFWGEVSKVEVKDNDATYGIPTTSIGSMYPATSPPPAEPPMLKLNERPDFVRSDFLRSPPMREIVETTMVETPSFGDEDEAAGHIV